MARVKRNALTFLSLMLLLTSCSTVNNNLRDQNNANHSIHNGHYLNCSLCTSNKAEKHIEVKEIENSSDVLFASNEKQENQIPNTTYFKVLNSIKNENVENARDVKILNTNPKYQKKAFRKFTNELDVKTDQVDEVKTKDAGLGLAIAGLLLGFLGLTMMQIALLLIPIGLLLSIIAWKISAKGGLARTIAIFGTVFNVIAFFVVILSVFLLSTLFVIMMI